MENSAAETTKRQNRSLELIAKFVDGYAQGWRFAVGECFRDALDIRLTERVNKDKKKENVWTQGRLYCFTEGDKIHDRPLPDTPGQPYRELLPLFSALVSVERGSPNLYAGDGSIVHGQILFALSAPTPDGPKALRRVGYFNATQDEFVEFLKTGVLRGQTLERMLKEGPPT